jgi:hypothetical protein
MLIQDRREGLLTPLVLCIPFHFNGPIREDALVASSELESNVPCSSAFGYLLHWPVHLTRRGFLEEVPFQH